MRSRYPRIDALLARMTWTEKIAQLHSIWIVGTPDGKLTLKTLAGLKHETSDTDPFPLMKDGIGEITRPLGSAPIDPRIGVKNLNKVQEFLVKHTRLGIPALPHEECLAGLMAQGSTMFPTSLNMGALWDEERVRDIGKAIGDEVHAVGSRQALAPVLDVVRDARWGRNEECFGEDPYHVGCMAVAYVEGLQGPDRRILATLKHFAGHSLSEGARNHAPVRVGRNELNDVFLLPFEMAVRLANAGSVMPAYHDIDGVPLHESREYLIETLREKWDFDGIIVADYEGIAQLHTEHRTRESLEDAAAAALNAGIDVELPSATVFGDSVLNAMDRGLVDGETVNAAVQRVLEEKLRLGLFDNPYAQEDEIELNSAAHRRLASKAAEDSIVLLANNGTLPLASGLKIALVGPLADDKLAFLNGYSFPIHVIAAGETGENAGLTTLKEAFESHSETSMVYRRGCDILVERPKDAPVFPGDVFQDGDVQKTCISHDRSRIDEAVSAAAESDVIVAAVGDLSGLFLTGTVGEGSDVTSLSLPGPQEALLDALLDTGKPLVVVLSSGRPYVLGRADTEAAAILFAGLPGSMGAEAIVRVLFGSAFPGGRLPISMPRSGGAMPFFYNHKMKSPGVPIQPDFGALRPFGFGLSYTTFEIDQVRIASDTVPMDGMVDLQCRVTNTGDRVGDETLQVYARDIYASLVRPMQELKAFRRTTVEPGSSVRIQFRIPTDMLSFTGTDGKRIVEPGDFEIMLGTSCRHIVHRSTITLQGTKRVLEGSWRMKSTAEVTKL